MAVKLRSTKNFDIIENSANLLPSSQELAQKYISNFKSEMKNQYISFLKKAGKQIKYFTNQLTEIDEIVSKCDKIMKKLQKLEKLKS